MLKQTMTYLRNPASTINWPFGFQNRWFTERFSSVSIQHNICN